MNDDHVIVGYCDVINVRISCMLCFITVTILNGCPQSSWYARTTCTWFNNSISDKDLEFMFTNQSREKPCDVAQNAILFYSNKGIINTSTLFKFGYYNQF